MVVVNGRVKHRIELIICDVDGKEVARDQATATKLETAYEVFAAMYVRLTREIPVGSATIYSPSDMPLARYAKGEA